MASISGEEKNVLIKLFQKRGVKFYHACQYKDFMTYVSLGGIPSRNIMQKKTLPYTTFDTDGADQTNKVWDMVFGNMSDSGAFFAGGKKESIAIPNTFGPILLVFNPEIFEKAEDIAICLHSAGASGFKREEEAISSTAEVNKIFVHEDIEKLPEDNPYAGSQIKLPLQLKETFSLDKSGTPEISCIVKNEILSFEHLHGIRVDQYTINKNNLFERVSAIKQKNNFAGWITQRNYKDGRRELIDELATILIKQEISLENLIQHDKISPELKEWGQILHKGGREFDFNRFTKYLREGTVLPLNEEKTPEGDIFNL